mmetsp:Transcript_205/g.415  ORF Transcript_205/g.415 Transcript_205/m.415 type:complete len:333 (-) Transcript_205:299-1297(-)
MLRLAFLLSAVLVARAAEQGDGQKLPEAYGLQAGVDLGTCSYSATCSVSGYEGACVSISAGCCSGGTQTANLCSGSSDIKCCTQAKCNTPYGSGTCMQTSKCGGKSYSGYCAGPSDMQCCVSGPPPPNPSASDYGVDVSQVISSSTASCLAGSNSFVIPRGFKSTGTVDSNVCTSIINAANAGIKTRDTYMFPCPTCSSSASSQLSTLVSYLKSHCSSQWSGRVWLDIEGSQYWLSSTSSNKLWYQDLVNACSSQHVRCGVYSSGSQWSAIFGSSSYSYGNNLPLWYAHYDNKPSFSDFSSFGGWRSPHAKQYAGDTTQCGLGVDKNYSPGF